MAKKQKNTWVMALLMIPIILMVSCQCVDAASVESEKTSSCHSESQPEQKAPNAKDCCGGCETENAAVLKFNTHFSPLFTQKVAVELLAVISKLSNYLSIHKRILPKYFDRDLSKRVFRLPATLRGPPAVFFP